jgi:hypothetical protein|tara:strand:+ start:4709 stop:5074 length:366 start_codon:yes stop_codon:yes gene_type:complete
VALSATGFHDAVDYKVIVDTNQTAVVMQENVAASPGRLFSVIVDCTQTVADHFVKLYDGTSPTAGSTAPDMTLKGTALKSVTYQIPFGLAFDKLNFCITRLKAQSDTTAPAAQVTVTLVCS